MFLQEHFDRNGCEIEEMFPREHCGKLSVEWSEFWLVFHFARSNPNGGKQ
jgi:hypothetical protein